MILRNEETNSEILLQFFFQESGQILYFMTSQCVRVLAELRWFLYQIFLVSCLLAGNKIMGINYWHSSFSRPSQSQLQVRSRCQPSAVDQVKSTREHFPPLLLLLVGSNWVWLTVMTRLLQLWDVMRMSWSVPVIFSNLRSICSNLGDISYLGNCFVFKKILGRYLFQKRIDQLTEIEIMFSGGNRRTFYFVVWSLFRYKKLLVPITFKFCFSFYFCQLSINQWHNILMRERKEINRK